MVRANESFEKLKSAENVNCKESWPSWKYVSSDSLGQNIVGKFKKITKIELSIECYTANVLLFSSTPPKSKFTFCVADWVLTIIRSISGILLRFPNFQRS